MKLPEYIGQSEHNGWYELPLHYRLSEKMIEDHKDQLCFECVALKQNLSCELMEKLYDYMPKSYLAKFQILDESFIRKHKEDLDPLYLFQYQKLSEELMDEYCKVSHPNLYLLSRYQKLSEEFIDAHKDIVDWDDISIYQRLSPEWMSQHLTSLNLYSIFKTQQLPISFIEDYMKYAPLEIVATYQTLPSSMREKLHRYELDENERYLSIDEKREKIFQTGLFDCHDDYFIAYKAIRKDRYSIYNFQYWYEKGGVYSENCDCMPTRNSFGLNVCTLPYAEFYMVNENDIIVRCKIRYEDVGRILGQIVRCFRIEILD